MGILRNWFSSSVRKTPKGRKLRRSRRRFEQLERREVLTATLFVDFGDGFLDPDAGGPLGPQLTMTAGQLADDVSSGGIQGPDLTTFAGIGSSTNLTFKPLSAQITFDYNGDSTINSQDYTDLKADVLALIAQTYSPFNVVVTTAANHSIAGIQSTLAANNGLGTGKNDAYLFVTSVDFYGGSVGSAFGLYGIANGYDIAAGQNTRDDSAIAFADRILASLSGNADTALAYTVAHEAGHNFGIEHADNNGMDTTRSEVMLESASLDHRKNPVFFSRMPLYTADSSPTEYNPAEQLGNDSDIGYKANRVYVTATGTDTLSISEYDATRNLVSMSWDDPIAMTTRYYSYFIPRSASEVYVYGGYGDNLIYFNGDLDTEVTLVGMAGNDRLFIQDAGSTFQQYADNSLTYLNTTINYAPTVAGESNSAIESISIEGTTGNDTLNLRSLFASTSWSFEGGAGTDTVNLYVSYAGNSGFLQNEFDGLNSTVQQLFQSGGVTYATNGNLTYSAADLEEMHFYGNVGSDRLIIRGLEYGTLPGGPWPPGWPPPYLTEYTFHGGGGTDTLDVSMANLGASAGFEQTATEITVTKGSSLNTLPGVIKYAPTGDVTEQVFFRGTSYDDYAHISTLDVSTYFVFLGGGGSDELTITASPTTQSAFDIQNGYISMLENRSGWVSLAGAVFFDQPGHAVENIVLEGGAGNDFALFSTLFEDSTFHFIGNGGTDTIQIMTGGATVNDSGTGYVQYTDGIIDYAYIYFDSEVFNAI